MVVNRECPKCGNDNADVKYDPVFEALDLECLLCRYKWQRKPLDVLKEDAIKQHSKGK